MKRLFVFLVPACFTWLCHAAPDPASGTPYLLVLSSDRNAENIAEAARMFRERHPEFHIQARTNAQLREQPAQAWVLVAGSSTVFGVGLYGPIVMQLLPQLKARNKPQLLLNSDHRLVKQSFWGATPPMSSSPAARWDWLKTIIRGS